MILIRSFRALFGVVSLLGWIGFNVAARAQTCTPPDEMKAKLRDKPSAEVLNDLGVWFAGHEQYECAANAFGSSLQADAAQPDLPHVVFEFGASLYLSGDTKEAIPSLQEAEKLGYRDGKIHVILATALDSTRAIAEAEAEWRKAVEFDPDNTAALDALSSDLLADGDFKGVIELLDRLRLAALRSPQQVMNLGTAYAKAAKPEDAVRILQDGLNTNPDSFEVAQQLAGVLAELNRKDEAAMVLQLAQARRQQNAAQAGK
jgi:tetratricopeptide (TPR) repeat protein